MMKAALIAAAGILLASPSFGHAKLVSSSPLDASTLNASPATLTLTFNEAVKLGSVALATAGRTLPVALDKAAAASVTIVTPLPALSPGRYDLRWSAVSPSDGHVSKGTLSFTVLPAAR